MLRSNVKLRQRYSSIAAIVLLGCGAEGPTDEGDDLATTAGRIEFDEADPVAASAQVIFVGHVEDLQTFVVDDGGAERFETLVTLVPERVERGVVAGKRVIVWTPGGVMGDLVESESDSAMFAVGERVRVFLDPSPNSRLQRVRSAPAMAAHLGADPLYVVRNGDLGKQVPHEAGGVHSGGVEAQNGFTYWWCFGSQPRYWAEWKKAIPYYVNANTADMVGEDGAVRMGFDAWEGEAGVRIKLAYQGPTSSTAFGNDNLNIVFWTPGQNMTDPNHTAETRSGCSNLTGQITESDIRLNDDLNWSTVASQTTSVVQHTAMHEAGHLIGLSHVTDNTQIMFHTYTPLARLSWGDRNGVRALYPGSQIPGMGDFNGDGLDDTVAFTNDSAADVNVALNNFNASGGQPGFGARTVWNGSFAPRGEWPTTGDFNGDLKTDIVRFTQGDGADVHVCLSNGSNSFNNCTQWHTFFAPTGEIPAVGDVNGDGKDDIIAFTRGITGDVWVALSNGAGFGTPSAWHTAFAFSGEIPAIGDVNGDNKDDLIVFVNSTWSNGVFVALSTGSAFGGAQSWHASFCRSGQRPRVGYLNGDNRADILCFWADNENASATVAYALSTGSSFGTASFVSGFFSQFQQSPFVGRVPTKGSLVSFTHCSAADVYVRSNALVGNSWGNAVLWDGFFAPGPCP